MDKRRRSLIIAISSICVCLFLFAYLVLSNISVPWPWQHTEAAEEWFAVAQPPIATDGRGAGVSRPDTLDPAVRHRVDKFVDVSMGTRLERTVTLCLAGAALDAVYEQARPGTPLSADADFLRTQLRKASGHLLDSEMSPEKIRHLAATTVALVRDRNISGKELSALVGLYNRELGLDMEEEKLAAVLEHLHEPGTRDELKRVMREETSVIVKKIRSNPITRRLLVTLGENAFSAYQDDFFSRLPPQVDRQEVQRLVFSALESMVDNSLSDNEIDVLCGLCVESLADRQISRAELEKITQYAAAAMEIPVLKKLKEKY
jgi:hypothetical protein